MSESKIYRAAQIEAIDAVAEEIRATLQKKNAAYGDSFHKQFEKYGAVASLIRMDDKFSRAQTLLAGAADNGESIRDTFLDIAGYAILTVIELDKAQAHEA